jgi:hypothetical protein
MQRIYTTIQCLSVVHVSAVTPPLSGGIILYFVRFCCPHLVCDFVWYTLAALPNDNVYKYPPDDGP